MIIRKPSTREWIAILKKCPTATIFATPSWIEIVNKTYGYKDVTKLFIFEDGQKVLLPLMQTRNILGIFSQYLSVPFYNYGGLFSAREISEDRVSQIFNALKGLTTRSVILCPHPLSRVKYPEKYKGDKYSTHILDLSVGFERIWKGYKDNDQARKARKARKEGITIKSGETLDDFRTYYEMYLDSAKRWGLSNPQPWALYENLYKFGGDMLKLWIAQLSDKTIAGIILGYFNKNVIYWGGSFYFNYGTYRPNNLLHIEAIKDACEKDYKIYDFLPSGGIRGVEKFKETFGVKKLDFYTALK